MLTLDVGRSRLILGEGVLAEVEGSGQELDESRFVRLVLKEISFKAFFADEWFGPSPDGSFDFGEYARAQDF